LLSFIRTFHFIILILLLSACQSTLLATHKTFYLDEAFPDYQNIAIETSNDIFSLDDEMLAMVEKKLKPERDIKVRASKLLHHIFKKEDKSLAYSTNANLTAREAYQSNTANCMSLTILAYVLAKEANLTVNFQSIDIPEYWVRNGQYSMLTGHVNLLITKPKSPSKFVFLDNGLLEIDFDPFAIKKSFPKKIISKERILAMFYNNKGAQFLANNSYDEAYAYLKAATEADPGFSSVWGNMGILYRVTGHSLFAENTYRYAVELNKDNLTALKNLSMLLGWQGKLEEMSRIDRELLIKRINNPFYHALLADEASFNGDNEKAVKHYKRAIKLDKKNHEFYYGLAKVYYRMSSFVLAKKAIRTALRLNKAVDIHEQYLAKLNFLKEAKYQ
jgi:Flp pilus assembly protein TadD